MAKTFLINWKGARTPHLYIRTFDLFGETWVIHIRVDGPGYRCSHKETGVGLPGADANTIKGSLAAAKAGLEQLGEGRVKAIVAEARKA